MYGRRLRLSPSSVFVIIERDLIGVTATRSMVLDEVFQGIHVEVREKYLHVNEVFGLSVAMLMRSLPNAPRLDEYGMNCTCDEVPGGKGRILRLNFRLIKRKGRKKFEAPEKGKESIIPVGNHYVAFWRLKGRSAVQYEVKSLGG